MILPLVNLRQGETGSHAAHRLLSALENAAPGPFCGWAVRRAVVAFLAWLSYTTFRPWKPSGALAHAEGHV
jgi:uncharacterized membrane protein